MFSKSHIVMSVVISTQIVKEKSPHFHLRTHLLILITSSHAGYGESRTSRSVMLRSARIPQWLYNDFVPEINVVLLENDVGGIEFTSP